MGTVHCVLYTVYCTLRTVHCVLYTAYSTLCTVHSLLYTVYWTPCTVHCILYTVCSVHCKLCSVCSVLPGSVTGADWSAAAIIVRGNQWETPQCPNTLHSTLYIFKALALWADAFYKSKRPSVYPAVFLSVCPSVRLFTFEVPFKRLFAPTFRSQISNIFRNLESFGKSNGKKWSQMWTFLFESCLNRRAKKNYFFWWFCLTKHGGNHASQWIRDLWSKGISQILAYL